MALPYECSKPGRSLGPAASFPEVGLVIRRQRKPEWFSIRGKRLTDRNTIYQDFSCLLKKGRPSGKRNVPSHRHGMDTGLSPPKLTRFSPATGCGKPICRGSAFTLA